jgi:putative DNA primase/helicase
MYRTTKKEAAPPARSRGPKEMLFPHRADRSINAAIAQQRYQLDRFREELSSGVALQMEALYPGHCAGRMLVCGALAAANERRCQMRSPGVFEALAAPGAVMITDERRFSRLTSSNNKYPTLDDARALFESNGHSPPVFLYIEAREKGPKWPRWPQVTYAQTQTEEYQRNLRNHANTGILLGSASGNLRTIDCDTDVFLKAMLDLNPWARSSFCTRGQSGGQIWFYMTDGPIGQKVFSLFVNEHSPLAAGARQPPQMGLADIGELRLEGVQSVVCGIHKEGMHYSWPAANPPIEIAFDQIVWPADIKIPWEPERKKTPDIPDDCLLKRAIEKLSVAYLWDHFGYSDRGNRNPVRSPWHPDDVDTSFSIYDESRRFKDHDPGRPDERGDSFNFYCLARGLSASDAFKPFVELAGLGDELREKAQPQTGDENKIAAAAGFNEFSHVKKFLETVPPIRCVGANWYAYETGAWSPTTPDRFRPIAQMMMKETVRTARRESGILNHVEGWSQVDESTLFGVGRFLDGKILINAQNGVIYIDENHDIRLGEHSPDFGFTQRLAVAYDPSAKCPLFERIIAEALPEPVDRHLLQLCAGNLLIPHCQFEVCVCCYGPGGNMKSTVAEAIVAVFETNSKSVTTLTLSQLCDPRGYSLPQLRLAAVNLGTELDAVEIEESSNFKRIISGEPFEAREIYGRPFTMTTTAKLWFLANNLPRFKHGSDAEMRRMRFLVFDQKPRKEDKTLKANVKLEASGILIWMLEGAVKVLKAGKIPFGGEDSKSAAETFGIQNDPLRAFIEKYCVLDPEARVGKDIFGNEFVEFCNSHGLPGEALKKSFFQRLYAAYPQLKPIRGRLGAERFQQISGINVKSDENDDESNEPF